MGVGDGVGITTGTLRGTLGELTGVAVGVGAPGSLVGAAGDAGAGAEVCGGGVGKGNEISGGSDASGGRFEGKLRKSDAGSPATRGSMIGLSSGMFEGTGMGRLMRAGSRASRACPCRALSLFVRRVPACIRVRVSGKWIE